MHQFKCPSCKRSLEARDTALGQRATCPKCGHTFTVPKPEGEEAPQRADNSDAQRKDE